MTTTSSHLYLGIGIRIAIGFLVVLLLMVSLTVVGLRYIDQTNGRLSNITQNNNVKSQLATTMLDALRERALGMHALAILDDPFEKDDEMMRFNALGSVYVTAREQLENMPLDDQELTILHDIRRLTRNAQPKVEKVVDMALLGRSKQAQTELMRNIAMPLQREIAVRVDDLIKLQETQTEQAVTAAREAYRQVWYLMIGLGAAALILGALIALSVGRKVTGQARQLALLAMYDNLTELPNRCLLFDRIKQVTAQSRRQKGSFALILFDLNNFKPINDTLGHEAGDRVLCHVAKGLEGSIRKADTVCRLGGDEFVVVLSGITPETIEPMMEKFARVLAEPIRLGGHNVTVGASAGVAFFPQHGESHERLLRNADIAMYTAKRAGKAFVIYEPGQDEGTDLDFSLPQGVTPAPEQV